MEKISVIVPVYNAEEYIEKCVSSIMNQTYKNLEIILINDGSTDNSGKMCDRYVKKDKRVVVLHKDNGGISSVRNTGIELATGDYIAFVDADDWISEDAFEYLIKNAKKYKADITCCRSYHVVKERKIFISDEKTYFFDKNEAITNLVSNEIIGNTVWRKLFKKKLFKGITFPINRTYEDIHVTHKLILKANKITVLPDAKYFFRRHNKSITKSPKTIRKSSDIVYANIVRYNDLSKQYPQLKELMMKNIIDYSIKLISVCSRNKSEIEDNMETLDVISDFLEDNYDYLSSICSKKELFQIKFLLTFSKFDLFRGNLSIERPKKIQRLKKRLKSIFK